MAKGKKSEVITDAIPVVEVAQYKLLSVPTQKLIKDLSEEMKTSSLTIFNPLIIAMAEIEGFRTIKYSEEDENTIKEFKNAKNTIRSFRATTKKVKKELKAPYLEIGKKLDTIESTFIDRATLVLEALEKEFKPYLDEEQRKAEEAEARRNAEQIAETNRLNAETAAQQLVINRMNAKARLDKEIFAIGTDITSKINNYSKEALKLELVALDKKEIEIDPELLLPDQVEEVLRNFRSAIQNAKQLLEMKISFMEQAPTQPFIPSPQINPVDELIEDVIESKEEFLAPALSKDDPEYFKTSILDILSDALISVENLVPTNVKEENVKTQITSSFLKLQEKIEAFL